MTRERGREVLIIGGGMVFTFAKAMGKLAKTDRVDARLLAMALQGAERADGVGHPDELTPRLGFAGPLAAHPGQGGHQLERVGHAVA